MPGTEDLQSSFNQDVQQLEDKQYQASLAQRLDDYAGAVDDLDSVAEGAIAELGTLEKQFGDLRQKYGLDTSTWDGNVSVKQAQTIFEKAAKVYKLKAEAISNKRSGEDIITDFVKHISRVKAAATKQLKSDFAKVVKETPGKKETTGLSKSKQAFDNAAIKKQQEKAASFGAIQELKGLGLDTELTPDQAKEFHEKMTDKLDFYLSQCLNHGWTPHHDGTTFSKNWMSGGHFSFHAEDAEGNNINQTVFTEHDLSPELYDIVDDHEDEFLSYLNTNFTEKYKQLRASQEKLASSTRVAGLDVDWGSHDNAMWMKYAIDDEIDKVLAGMDANSVPDEANPFSTSSYGGYIECDIAGQSDPELFTDETFTNANAPKGSKRLQFGADAAKVEGILDVDENTSKVVKYMNERWQQKWETWYRENRHQAYTPMEGLEELKNPNIALQKLSQLDHAVQLAFAQIEAIAGDSFGDENVKAKLDALEDDLGAMFNDYKVLLTKIQGNINYKDYADKYKAHFLDRQNIFSGRGTDRVDVQDAEEVLAESESQERIDGMIANLDEMVELRSVDELLNDFAGFHRDVDSNNWQTDGVKQGYRSYAQAFGRKVFEKIQKSDIDDDGKVSLQEQKGKYLQLIKILRAEDDYEIDDDLRDQGLLDDVFSTLMMGKTGKNGDREGGLIDSMNFKPFDEASVNQFGTIKNSMQSLAQDPEKGPLVKPFLDAMKSADGQEIWNIQNYNALSVEQRVMFSTFQKYQERFGEIDPLDPNFAMQFTGIMQHAAKDLFSNYDEQMTLAIEQLGFGKELGLDGVDLKLLQQYQDCYGVGSLDISDASVAQVKMRSKVAGTVIASIAATIGALVATIGSAGSASPTLAAAFASWSSVLTTLGAVGIGAGAGVATDVFLNQRTWETFGEGLRDLSSEVGTEILATMMTLGLAKGATSAFSKLIAKSQKLQKLFRVGPKMRSGLEQAQLKYGKEAASEFGRSMAIEMPLGMQMEAWRQQLVLGQEVSVAEMMSSMGPLLGVMAFFQLSPMMKSFGKAHALEQIDGEITSILKTMKEEGVTPDNPLYKKFENYKNQLKQAQKDINSTDMDANMNVIMKNVDNMQAKIKEEANLSDAQRFQRNFDDKLTAEKAELPIKDDKHEYHLYKDGKEMNWNHLDIKEQKRITVQAYKKSLEMDAELFKDLEYVNKTGYAFLDDTKVPGDLDYSMSLTSAKEAMFRIMDFAKKNPDRIENLRITTNLNHKDTVIDLSKPLSDADLKKIDEMIQNTSFRLEYDGRVDVDGYQVSINREIFAENGGGKNPPLFHVDVNKSVHMSVGEGESTMPFLTPEGYRKYAEDLIVIDLMNDKNIEKTLKLKITKRIADYTKTIERMGDIRNFKQRFLDFVLMRRFSRTQTQGLFLGLKENLLKRKKGTEARKQMSDVLDHFSPIIKAHAKLAETGGPGTKSFDQNLNLFMNKTQRLKTAVKNFKLANTDMKNLSDTAEQQWKEIQAEITEIGQYDLSADQNFALYHDYHLLTQDPTYTKHGAATIELEKLAFKEQNLKVSQSASLSESDLKTMKLDLNHYALSYRHLMLDGDEVGNVGRKIIDSRNRADSQDYFQDPVRLSQAKAIAERIVGLDTTRKNILIELDSVKNSKDISTLLSKPENKDFFVSFGLESKFDDWIDLLKKVKGSKGVKEFKEGVVTTFKDETNQLNKKAA